MRSDKLLQRWQQWTRGLLTAACLACLSVGSTAAAHATLVIGNLSVAPDPPVPGAPLEVTLRLEDTLLVPVEKAHVRVELRAVDPEAGPDAVPASAIGSDASEFLASDPDVSSGRFTEAAVKGVYVGQVVAPAAGDYTLSVRDTTFLNEEAIANIELAVGGAANGAIAFVLPPTPIAPKSLSTWLIWLVGIPLLAGVVTTVLVLRKPAPAEQPADEGQAS